MVREASREDSGGAVRSLLKTVDDTLAVLWMFQCVSNLDQWDGESSGCLCFFMLRLHDLSWLDVGESRSSQFHVDVFDGLDVVIASIERSHVIPEIRCQARRVSVVLAVSSTSRPHFEAQQAFPTVQLGIL